MSGAKLRFLLLNVICLSQIERLDPRLHLYLTLTDLALSP